MDITPSGPTGPIGPMGPPGPQGPQGNPRRRFTRILRENWYRDVWLLIITVLVLLAVSKTYGNVGDIQDGRRVGTNVTCSATSAIIDAGRDTIRNAATITPTEFEKNLVALGLPRRKARTEAANQAAKKYGESIASAVALQTGRSDIVLSDGSLDCAALQRATRVDK